MAERAIGSLCSGIGLLELGLERAGLGKVQWQVEADPWCRDVLATHWPEAVRHEDIRSATALAPVGVVCAGFPCQPVSLAGRRQAQADTRWLWPDCARIIAEVRPAIVVVENVLGLRTAGLRDVLSDLADLGFDAEWTCLSALDVGAPHLRKRLFVVATHAERVDIREPAGWLARSCDLARAPVTRDALTALLAANPDGEQRKRKVRNRRADTERSAAPRDASHADSLRRVESALRFAELRGWSRYCGWSLREPSAVDDGRTTRLVRGQLARQRRALGNAVVVAAAEAVGRACVEAIAP